MNPRDRMIRQVFLRTATVLALGRDSVGSPLFDRHLVQLDRFVALIPDHPDDPLYAVRCAAAALVEGRRHMALADWTTLRWHLSGALRDYMVIAAAQAVERYEARAAG